MSQREIIELALSAAVDGWGEARNLAGLEGSLSCANYSATAKPSELKRYAELVEVWNEKISFLEGVLASIEAAEKEAARQARKAAKQAAARNAA